MILYKKNYFKKALIISFLIELVLGSVFIWAVYTQGHSGYTLGLFFHIPSSFIGVLVLEAMKGYPGIVAANTSIFVTIFLQFIFLLIGIQYFLEYLSKNLDKHNQDKE